MKEFNIKIAVADLKHGGVICDNINKKLRFSKVELPSDDRNGEFTFDDKGITLKLTNTIDGKFIRCAYREFGGFDDFYCNIFLKKNIEESLSELAPFERNRKYYYFKRFMPCYTAQGAIKLGGIEYSLKENTARAYIDKTRYFKPREHQYQRLSADCMLGGKRFSLNLASRVGDNRYGNENCFFYDGKLEKLSQITVKGTPTRKALADHRQGHAEPQRQTVLLQGRNVGARYHVQTVHRQRRSYGGKARKHHRDFRKAVRHYQPNRLRQAARAR